MRLIAFLLLGSLLTACTSSSLSMPTRTRPSVPTFTPTPFAGSPGALPPTSAAPPAPTLMAIPPLSTATAIPGLDEAIDRALAFLSARYNSEYSLLNESPDARPTYFWLATDNWLAARALQAAGAVDRAELIRARIGDTRHGLIEALDGEIVTWPPFTETQILIEKVLNDEIKTEERVSGERYEDWEEYADLVLYGALNEHSQRREAEARRRYNLALSMFNGIGFEDKAYTAPDSHGFFAIYKVALALYVGQTIGLPPDSRLLPALLAKQNDSGGFVTLYDANGIPKGDANTETTSYAILALTALRNQAGR